MFTLGIWAKLSLGSYLELCTDRFPIVLASRAADVAFQRRHQNTSFLLRSSGLSQIVVLLGGLSAGPSGLFYRKESAEGFQQWTHRNEPGV
eukprot:g24383.t1